MRICIISDTHMQHQYLPDLEGADVLIHCGDITGSGSERAVEMFMEWFEHLDQFKYKILVAGNHDFLFELDVLRAKELTPDNVIYLEDDSITIDGINFYGTPAQKRFGRWAFNKSESKLTQHYEAIPDNVDVLITHAPPYGIGDLVVRGNTHEGSQVLYHEVINRIKPKIHCFGHIHEDYGITKVDDVTFINASVLDETYVMMNDPIYITI